MEAGRELDALVAEKAMGYRWFVPCNPKYRGEVRRILWLKPWSETSFKTWDGNESVEPFGDWDREVPRFSTDISAAWSVVEKMREHGFFDVTVQTQPSGVLCEITKDEADQYCAAAEDAETAPLAICRAALRALGVEVQ